jgi:opacity protein-like surface antigen
MKKILASLLMATVAFSASAGSASIEYHSWKNQDTNAYTDGIVVTVREKLSNSLTGDLVFSGFQARANNAIGSRLETGLTAPIAKLGPVNVTLRGAVGMRYTNTADSSYYSIQPTMSYRVTDKVTTSLGYRFRDSFDSAVADQTRSVRVGAAYALTKVDSVGVRFDRVRGDSNINLLAVTYSRQF